MNFSELKAQGRAAIAGKIGILFLIELIIALLSAAASGILSLIPFGGLVASIVITPAFALSTVRVFLSLFGGKQPEVTDAFSGFDDFFSAFKVSFLTGLFSLLWSLLFIIPGIVKSISYSMAMYILAENKGKSALECIEESKQMTEGHKMELFLLTLSFIGWFLLCVVTFFIAAIWVVPYMNATMAAAYRSLKPAAPAPTADEPQEPAEGRPTISSDNSFKNI